MTLGPRTLAGRRPDRADLAFWRPPRGAGPGGEAATMRRVADEGPCMTGPQAASAPPPRLIVVLVLATALGPFAMQVFLPALPAIQAGFGVSAATAQLSFSLSAFAIAISTLFYGPISDRLGRRRPCSAVSPSTCRQPALRRGSLDHASHPRPDHPGGRWLRRAGADAGRSSATSTASTAPPRAGLRHHGDGGGADGGARARRAARGSGRMALGVRRRAAVGLLILVAVHGGLPETAQRAGAAGGPPIRCTVLAAFCARRHSWAMPCRHPFSIAVFYAFLAAAPFLMLTVMQRPASEYGLFFILVSGAFMVGNFVAGRYSARVGSDRMILWEPGLAGLHAADPGPDACGLLDAWAIFLPTSLGALSQGVALPNTQAAFVSVDPQAAGTASGLGGFLQMGMAALVAQIVGSISGRHTLPDGARHGWLFRCCTGLRAGGNAS